MARQEGFEPPTLWFVGVYRGFFRISVLNKWLCYAVCYLDKSVNSSISGGFWVPVYPKCTQTVPKLYPRNARILLNNFLDFTGVTLDRIVE